MKTKEINKGCSLSGVEWDTIEFIGLRFDSAHPTHFADFLTAQANRIGIVVTNDDRCCDTLRNLFSAHTQLA
jgi:hypothetical protein